MAIQLHTNANFSRSNVQSSNEMFTKTMFSLSFHFRAKEAPVGIFLVRMLQMKFTIEIRLNQKCKLLKFLFVQSSKSFHYKTFQDALLYSDHN